MITGRKSHIDAVFAGGGLMGGLTRAYDWSNSPIGEADRWPQSLVTALSICLSSRAPIIIFWGPEHVQFYNDPFLPILGGKHPRALGQRYRDCFPEVWDLTGPMLRDVLERGESVGAEDRMLVLERRGQREECYFTWSYSPIRDESGVGGVFTVATETTPRVLRERRLRMLRDLATGLLETPSIEAACASVPTTLVADAADIPFGMMYLVDPNGSSEPRLAGCAGLPVEPPFQALEPWPFGAALNHRSVFDQKQLEAHLGFVPWLQLPDAAAEPIERAWVVPIRTPGQEQPAAILVAGLNPLRPLDGDYESFLEVVINSIGGGISYASAHETERHRAEALAEIDRAKTAFFSNVSHEFRTPLTLLLGPLQDALNRGSLGGEALQMATRNALHLVRLVNTLLDFSRIEAGRVNASYQLTDLPVLTANVASNFESAVTNANLRFIVDTPPLPADMSIYVDREMWEKIVLNLVSNALKHTFEGEISVTLQPADDHQAVELVVRDTGIGIPPGELPRVFERFHRVQDARSRSYEGSGIGLALVQELMRLHGGTASVDSVVGEGSAFRMQLPQGSAHLPADRIVRPTPLASSSDRAAPFVEEALRWFPDDPIERVSTEDAGGRRERILVADDNADMRRHISNILSEHWQVQAVADGQAAVAAVRDSMPDLLVLDVMMPRLDGFGVLKALRSGPSTPDVPVVLLSARAGEEASVEGLAAGANDYLIKPFAAAELVARVRTQLEAAHARADARAAAAARDAFVAVVAHDLRHPLAALTWHVQMLRLQLNSTEPHGRAQITEMLGSIEDCAARLSTQIDELSDVSQVQAGRPLELKIERTDLVELARAIVAQNRQGSESPRVLLRNEIQDLLGAWDAERLQRVVSNLISNAIKYSPDGGDVVVTLARQGDEAVLAVEDHGLGIPSADLPNIFEPYVRASNVVGRIRGSGLGLTGARDIVEQHRGTLTVTSAEGQGSTFVMRLPLALDGATPIRR